MNKDLVQPTVLPEEKPCDHPVSENRLTSRDNELLEELFWANRGSSYPLAWARPLDVGGSNGSHHSNTLTKLEKFGLVESKQRGWADPIPGQPKPKWRLGSRGAKVYRITDAGIAVLPPRRKKAVSPTSGDRNA